MHWLTYNKMDISIIIPTFNAEKTIGYLLSALLYINDSLVKEIVIIDSGSFDKTLDLIHSFKKKLPIHLLKINKEGFNHGITRNYGTQYVHGTYVLFLTQDAIPNKNSFLLDNLIAGFKRADVVACFGNQISKLQPTSYFQALEGETVFKELNQHVNSSGYLLINTKHDTGNPFLNYFLSNTFCCYRRSFLLTHPFKNTMYGEDVEMGKQIFESGLSKIYYKNSSVMHSHCLNLIEYYKWQKIDFFFKKRIGLKQKTNIKYKVSSIIRENESIFSKCRKILELIFLYIIKFVVFISYVTTKPKNKSSSS